MPRIPMLSPGTDRVYLRTVVRGGNNPIIRNGPDQFDDVKAGPCTVYRRTNDYIMFYEGIDSSLDPDGAGPNSYAAICWATASSMNRYWGKQGRKVTPLASPSWENSEACPTSLVYDGSQYFLYYHGGNNDGTVRKIGVMTSPDLSSGGTWTRYGSNPIISNGGAGAPDELYVTDCKVIRVGPGDWRMWYIGRNAADKGRICLARSADGFTWSKYASNPVLTAGSAGTWEENQINGFSITMIGTQFHALYIGTNNSNADQLGYAISADGITWVKSPLNPVLGDATDDDLTDSVDILYEGTRAHIVYGQYDLVGDTLRGKGYAYSDMQEAMQTPMLDDANRPDDSTPPPGSSWVAIAGRTAGEGLVVLGNALTRLSTGGFRQGDAWPTKFMNGHPEVWVDVGRFPTAFGGNPGCSVYILHVDPTVTDVNSSVGGWRFDWNVTGTSFDLNVAPQGAGAGTWLYTFQTGEVAAEDRFGLRFDGARVDFIRRRNGLDLVFLTRTYNALPDDLGGNDFTTPYNAALSGTPFWFAIDVTGDQELRLAAFGGSPITDRTRAAVVHSREGGF